MCDSQSECDCLAYYENYVEGEGCSLVDVCPTANCHVNANCSTVGPNEYRSVGLDWPNPILQHFGLVNLTLLRKLSVMLNFSHDMTYINCAIAERPLWPERH